MVRCLEVAAGKKYNKTALGLFWTEIQAEFCALKIASVRICPLLV